MRDQCPGGEIIRRDPDAVPAYMVGHERMWRTIAETRGICGHCGKAVLYRNDGTLRVHSVRTGRRG